MSDLCKALNDIHETTLYCEEANGGLTITKKYFSDFFPFNLGHLTSLMIEAKSEVPSTHIEAMIFTIGLSSLQRFFTFGAAALVLIIASYLFLTGDLTMGFSMLAFVILGLLWTKIGYDYGLRNFLDNWDVHISSSAVKRLRRK